MTGDRDDEKPEVIGICDNCGKQIPIPDLKDEIWSYYFCGLITVYGKCLTSCDDE